MPREPRFPDHENGGLTGASGSSRRATAQNIASQSASRIRDGIPEF